MADFGQVGVGTSLRWDVRNRPRAATRGAMLYHFPTREDLVEAIYVDGVSTRARVGFISGRGVGMAALRQTTQGLGGRIEVQSDAGAGTTLRFRFPIVSELTIAA